MCRVGLAMPAFDTEAQALPGLTSSSSQLSHVASMLGDAGFGGSVIVTDVLAANWSATAGCPACALLSADLGAADARPVLTVRLSEQPWLCWPARCADSAASASGGRPVREAATAATAAAAASAQLELVDPQYC